MKIVLLFKIQPLPYFSDRRTTCILQNKSMKTSRLVKKEKFWVDVHKRILDIFHYFFKIWSEGEFSTTKKYTFEVQI